MSDLIKILSWFNEAPSVARAIKAASQLHQLNALDLPQAKIAILRDTTLEQLVPFLEVNCFRAGIRPSVYMCPFGAAQSEAHNVKSDLYAASPDIVIIAFRLEAIAQNLVKQFSTLSSVEADRLEQDALDAVLNAARTVRENAKSIILVHNFEVPQNPVNGILDGVMPGGQINRMRRLNLRLADEVGKIGDAYVVDMDQILSQIGYEAGIDNRFWHIARLPYSPACLNLLAKHYSRFVAALKGKNKKCLVLDCDNTLWGGIIGEDGMAGIKLGSTYPGSAYRAFQLAILDLYHRGVLLALNSKNNHADVLEVLNTHPDCPLKPKHFAAMRVNWQDKASNLKEIAAELNLGIDSFVFADDSKVECDFVREALPEVQVVSLGTDPTCYENQLRGLGAFDSLAITAEDLDRTKLYQAEGKRRELQGKTGSYQDYLHTLEMELCIERGGLHNKSRIAQLTQKTNQFNLTTKRYSEAQIQSFLEDQCAVVYSARLKDKFGDNGLVGVAIVRHENPGAVIDTFLLSCRVIARGVEDAILATIVADAKKASRKKLSGTYYPTSKNGIVADFYAKNGFQKRDDNSFELNLESVDPKLPAWLNVVTSN